MLARFVLPLLLLIAITALLWVSYGLASSYRLFGSAAFSTAFLVAALVSTVILCVFVTATLVLRVGFAWLVRNDPTQLQRGLVVAVLTFIAAAIALWYSGLDLSTILTTSALLSMIVGLSVQPMLASLMSGLTVQGLMRIGDGVLLDGEPIEITSLNWRTVTGRRANGSAVVVPNARLADGTLQVLAHDRPTRVEVKLDAPTSMAPHRVRKLVTELVTGFAEVDATLPVVVLPVAYDANKTLTGYRVEFWLRHYALRNTVEGRVLRRFWYAFQREGGAAPAGVVPSSQSDLESANHVSAVMAALSASSAHHDAAAAESLAKSVLATGEILRYDDGERIVVPMRLAGRVYVLLEGELSEIPLAVENADVKNPRDSAARAGDELTRAVSLSLIERALAQHIGPYAAHAVEQASAGGVSLTTVCTTVALEIDDPAARQAFLDQACPPAKRIWGPGLVFRAAPDTAQRLVASPPMRAYDHALILAVPETAFEPNPLNRGKS